MLIPEIVFTDNMVLQRDKNIRVFGKGDDGAKIKVILRRNHKKSVSKTVVSEGKWEVVLPKENATMPDEKCTLTITDGKDVLEYENVVIGEVWFAGGQSNMEFELQNATGGKKILKKPLEDDDVRKNLRFFYTPKVSILDDEYEGLMRQSSWQTFSKDNAKAWSAVGFYFGVKLIKELGVTVGIIGCNWGGTQAKSWMSREALLSRESTKCFVDEYDNSEAHQKSEEEQIKDYKDYLKYQEEWDKKAFKIYEKDPFISWEDIQKEVGPNQFPGPLNCACFSRPYGLYETMVRRITPYTLAGVIYYQGESDEGKPELYYDLQTELIECWRKDFKDEELPFIMTLLPMHRYKHDPDTKSWCIIREAQMKVYKTVKNTGIAVIIDCGEFHQIHPPKKNKVGKRLALQALNLKYNFISEEEAFGPVYRDFILKKGGMELHFDYADGGFTVNGKEDLGFEIAGNDGVFEKATAKFKGNTVFLKSKKVKDPVMARYLWSNYQEVYVFGANKLPMAPFRTHEF